MLWRWAWSHRGGGSRLRALLAAVLLVGASVLLVLFVAHVVGPRPVPVDPLWLAAGCISLAAVAGLVALRPSERPAAVLLAGAWIVLLLLIALRVATEVDMMLLWVELPAGALPLRVDDVFRVCLRDGLAGASAGAQVVGTSFRPIH